jgi:hypothetical protein
MYYGYGESESPNGQYFKGYKKEFKLHGPGEYLKSDLTLQKGWFENDKFIGEIKDFNENGITDGIGKLEYDNDSYYVGNWKEKKFNGEGLFVFGNGDWYLGGFKDGTMHGKGKYFQKDKAAYIGSFINGKLHGRGIVSKPYYMESSHMANHEGVYGTFSNGEFFPDQGLIKPLVGFIGAASGFIAATAVESLIEASVAAAIYEPCTPEIKVKVSSNTSVIGGIATKRTTTKVTNKGC